MHHSNIDMYSTVHKYEFCADKNKTNYPISSNIHPSATMQKWSNTLGQKGWGGKGYKKPKGISYNFDKVWSDVTEWQVI